MSSDSGNRFSSFQEAEIRADRRLRRKRRKSASKKRGAPAAADTSVASAATAGAPSPAAASPSTGGAPLARKEVDLASTPLAPGVQPEAPMASVIATPVSAAADTSVASAATAGTPAPAATSPSIGAATALASSIGGTVPGAATAVSPSTGGTSAAPAVKTAASGKGKATAPSPASKKKPLFNFFGKPRTEKQKAAAKERRERQEAERLRIEAESKKRAEERKVQLAEAKLQREREKQAEIHKMEEERARYKEANKYSRASRQNGMFDVGDRKKIGMSGQAMNAAGAGLKLVGRGAATVGGAAGYSMVMVGAYALGGPIAGGVVGGITGFYAALKANKAHAEANPNESKVKSFFRSVGRVLSMTAAGFGAGAIPPPGNLLAVGPAIALADKTCSIGSHPKKGWKRHVGDIMGSIIPGAGLYQYCEKRNVELLSGKPIQPPLEKPLKPEPTPPNPDRGHSHEKTSSPIVGAAPPSPDKGVASTSPPAYDTVFPNGPPAEFSSHATPPATTPGARPRAASDRGVK